MTTEDGIDMKPLTGARHTGIKNIGNSCYMGSVVQVLVALNAFSAKYVCILTDSRTSSTLTDTIYKVIWSLRSSIHLNARWNR